MDIRNGGRDLFDERSAAKMLYNEDERAFALRERELEGHGIVQSKISFSGGEQNKKRDSSVQVEVSVEVNEHVERLVRRTYVLREDGDRQQFSREVISTVGTGTQHGWSKTFKVCKKDCVWPLRGKLIETDQGGLDVVSVSSGSSVVWCPTAFRETLHDIFPFDGECICRSCEPQRYLSQPERPSCRARGTRKMLNPLFSEKVSCSNKGTLLC